MSTAVSAQAEAKKHEIVDEKPSLVHREYSVDEEGKREITDYSGAHAKTDPAEIKLVKKLDTWIMPTLWIMYWLNYLVSTLHTNTMLPIDYYCVR